MLVKSKRSIFIVFLAIGFCILAAQPSHASTVVNFDATGIVNVYGFQFDILGPTGTQSTDFTPSLPSGYIDGTFGIPDTFVSYFTSGSGTPLPTGPIGSFLTVNAVLDNFLIFNSDGGQIPMADYIVQQVGTNYNLSAAAVPIPGALLLLGSGLIGMVGVRRKLNRA